VLGARRVRVPPSLARPGRLSRFRPVNEPRTRGWIPERAYFAIWSSSAFLFYLGTLVVLVAVLWLLESLNGPDSDLGLVGWATLALAALVGIAEWLRRAELPILAGLAAFISLIVFAVWVGSTLDWLGFEPEESGSFFQREFGGPLLVIEAAIVAAGVAAVRLFRFPLLMLPVALVAWYGLVDNISLLAGDPGDDAHAVVAILVGLLLVGAAVWLDRNDRSPYAFWPHVVGSVAVGGGILELLGNDDWAWALGGLISLAYVGAARVFGRSNYAVIGAIGVLAVGGYFIEQWYSFISIPFFFEGDGSSGSTWEGPLGFIVLGALLVVLGLLVDRGTRARGHRVSSRSP
jgi:hypothetical protein